MRTVLKGCSIWKVESSLLQRTHARTDQGSTIFSKTHVSRYICLTPALESSKVACRKRTEHGQVSVKLSLWTPKFGFSIFFTCHKNSIFLLMIFFNSLKKNVRVIFSPQVMREWVGGRLAWPAGCGSVL